MFFCFFMHPDIGCALVDPVWSTFVVDRMLVLCLRGTEGMAERQANSAAAYCIANRLKHFFKLKFVTLS